MSEATRADVDLILKLYDLRREETMRKARKFMIEEFYGESAKEFMEKYPPGTEKNAYFRQVLTYWEMVGVFVHKGLLDAELLFETTSEFHIFWEKARAVTLDLRKLRNMPLYLKNLENLAAEHKAFMENKAPGSSAFFASLNRRPVQKT
ncbi:MAG TPA: hypothetical protein VE398_00490 [Acidobacteriota bacterium]|nr:hypothetical protein [Acidobacteriota bacterium]